VVENMKIGLKCFNQRSYEGHCCCNCSAQIEIRCHPGNTGDAKGLTSETFAWACQRTHYNHAIFFTGKHGMCEMHTTERRKPWSYG